jgi:hypothetical protein
VRTSTPENFITLSGTIGAETEKAILFTVHGVDSEEVEPKKEWFPLSQVKSITRAAVTEAIEEQEEDVIVVKEWICKQKGLV